MTTTAASGPALTRTMLTEMTQGKPDVVVFELGDGLLGAYGVEAILASPDIAKALSAVILSANDPVAAWGGVKLLRERFDIEPTAVTGPATDNAVGVEHHQGPDGRERVQRDHGRRGARRSHHRQPRPRRETGAGSLRMTARVPAIVLGGTGYVAGELLRLLATHPYLDLAAVASDSQPDEPVAQFFRHLQPVLPHLRFASHDEIIEYVTANPVTAVFSAAPHGVSAGLIDRLLTAAEQAGTNPRVVDISADFRYTERRGVRGRLQARRTARRHESRNSPARCPST